MQLDHFASIILYLLHAYVSAREWINWIHFNDSGCGPCFVLITLCPQKIAYPRAVIFFVLNLRDARRWCGLLYLPVYLSLQCLFVSNYLTKRYMHCPRPYLKIVCFFFGKLSLRAKGLNNYRVH